MKKFILSILFSLICSLSLDAQSLDKDYSPVKSSGSIPEFYTRATTKKIAEDTKAISIDKDARDKGKQKEFAIHINYAIDNELRSGDILFNEEVGTYINKVADEVFKSDPALRKELKLIPIKVPEMNAFCMSKGYIFINIGLVAKLENEAQLAFILSHEVSHYVKKHNLNLFIESKKIDKEYKKSSFEAREIEKLAFSKENETEADMYGFQLYGRTSYPAMEAVQALDLLQYSYIPVEEIEFKTTTYNDEFYKIPSRYFLEELQGIRGDDKYDETKSSHPNIMHRKQNLDSLVKAASQDKKSAFLVSEQEFLRIRDICRFEMCRLYLMERNYFNALLTANVLLKKYPDNLYLSKVVSRALFAMCLYKNGDMKYTDDSYRKGPIPDYTKTEGYSQQLNFMLDKIPQNEMAILALRENWKFHKKFPSEPVFSNVCDSLFTMLSKKFKMGRKDFYDTVQENVPEQEYYRYGFTQLLKTDQEFIAKLELLKGSSGNAAVGLKVFVPPVKGVVKPKKEVAVSPKLGITKIMVIDPYYRKIDENISRTSMYSITDRKKDDFISIIKSNAARRKIQCEILDPENITVNDVSKLNDFSVFSDWFNERMEGGELQDCPIFNTEEVPALISKYGTKYFLWNGVFAVRFKAKSSTFTHYEATFYFAVLFDIETGKVVMKKYVESKMGDSAIRIDDYVDDAFDEILKLNAFIYYSHQAWVMGCNYGNPPDCEMFSLTLL